MNNKNDQLKPSLRRNKLFTVLDIFVPSALGLITYVTIFVITLLFSQPSQYKTDLQSINAQEMHGTFVYKYLNDFNNAINSQIVSQIAVYIFWVVVGIIVFVIASRIIKGVNELTDDYSLRSYIWPRGQDKNNPMKEFFEKLGFRLVILIFLLFYIFKATPYLASLWRKTNLSIGLDLHIVTTGFLLLIIEVIYFHILIVLVRLFLLRRRIINF